MKEQFKNLQADTVCPLLGKNGFNKKALTFYKSQGDLIYIINFQKSHGNSTAQTTFYINCGVHSLAIDRVIGNPEYALPKEYNCYFSSRISKLINSGNDAYTILPDTNIHQLSLQLHTDLIQVLSIYNSIESTKDLTNLMITQNGLHHYEELFEYFLLTQDLTGLSLFIRKFHNDFSADKRWHFFANTLNELLKKHNYKGTISDWFS